MLHCVVWQKLTNISEELPASIMRVMNNILGDIHLHTKQNIWLSL
jgi:hypothetical protein